MDRLKAGISNLFQTGNQTYTPQSPRDLYYLYKEEFGFPPKYANHLVAYAKTKNYILKKKKAEDILTDPPNPPIRKLDTGGFEWSDDDIDSSSDHDESTNEQKTNQINIVIEFHLDIASKQWPKSSKTFFSSIRSILRLTRSDYDILTETKYENQIKIVILIRKCNNSWRNPETDMDYLKSRISKDLSTLTKSFKDSTHLLKMVKKLQFGEIDMSGKNQVDRADFDAYFNTYSIEPLEKHVLRALFDTLDADGDGEITSREFSKWKKSFSSKTLKEMFPIISFKITETTYRYERKNKETNGKQFGFTIKIFSDGVASDNDDTFKIVPSNDDYPVIDVKEAINKIKNFQDFFYTFQLTDECKQKFMQEGFSDIASLEYIDEYVLYEKIGTDKNIGQ
eukprot:3694_1